MKKIHYNAIAAILIIMLSSPGCLSDSGKTRTGAIIIDHTCLNSSNDISLSGAQIAKAAAMRLYFEHASVGTNIATGLDSLYSSDSRYNRGKFVDYARGNPLPNYKVDWFVSTLTKPEATGPEPPPYQNPAVYDAMMMKFCYIDDRDNKLEVIGSIEALFEHYRDEMNKLESLFPGTAIVWWTMPLETEASGNSNSRKQTYNNLIRNYCNANNKILFDIADIESHDPAGNHITSSGYECLYSAYTDDGGHLNETGSLRAAKAFWQMAYEISQR